MMADDGGIQEGAARLAAAEAAPAFHVQAPAGALTPLICASPHSGRTYPAALLAEARLSLRHLRRSEDALVDQLIADAPALGAPLIAATLARAYVDLNRDPLELDPALFAAPLPSEAKTASARVAAGMGVIPRLGAEGRDIYAAPLALSEIDRRVGQAHRAYHAALAQLVEAARTRFGQALLIDWHSMPGSAARLGGGADIVLGDLHGRACAPALMDGLEELFFRQGLRCRRNTPYAGGYTTEHYGQPWRGVHAVQVEINRELYFDEQRLEPTPGFDLLRRRLQRVLGELARAWPLFLAP